MRRNTFLVFGLFIAFSRTIFAQEVISLPLTVTKGYGLFNPQFAIKTAEAAGDPYQEAIKGIPAQLKQVKRYHLLFDEKQFYYQLYHQRKLSEQRFEELKQFLKYEPTETDFSKKQSNRPCTSLPGKMPKAIRCGWRIPILILILRVNK